MKITNISTLCLSRPHELERQWVTAKVRVIKADCAIVVVETDEGITGVGEACAYGQPLIIRDWIDWYSPLLVGHDPTDPRIVPSPHNKSWAHDCAIGGLDSALWDLKGKIAGKPVSRLLAVHPLQKVRLYASSGCRYDWRIRPEQLIDEALEYIAAGYTAMKFRIGTDWTWDGVTVDRFLGLVRELAQTVNGRMELMLDGNQRLTIDQALAVAKELERLNFRWFEEPIPQADIDGYARINSSVAMPITGGEQFTTIEQFRPYLEKKAYKIVQPDAGICGISAVMQIAEVAHRYGVDLCPHNWHNGLMTMANAHAVAALPNPIVLELCMIQGPLQWDILQEKPPIVAGWLELPQSPGLGAGIADGLESRYPYIEGSYAITVER
ncbi:MAG: mandelate racemase/muconate lactonizing enzyme family protein [Chloroflexi bacterium]|nr:mandelate racemase/muconate lactonizing enzyme family protein [Chloroflexota bacterium]MCL5273729.1 mandelate racemase/muconate lactonizing enzyme family protein [Chloroflexota bacterium]